MSIISDMIEGFVILALLCGIYGFTSDMIKKAGEAQGYGIMNYSDFTKELTKSGPKVGHSKSTQ